MRLFLSLHQPILTAVLWAPGTACPLTHAGDSLGARSRPAARGQPSEALSGDRGQMGSVWNLVGVWGSLSDIYNQTRVVPRSLALQIPAV